MNTSSATHKEKESQVPSRDDQVPRDEFTRRIFKCILSHPAILMKWISMNTLVEIAKYIPNLPPKNSSTKDHFYEYIVKKNVEKNRIIDQIKYHCEKKKYKNHTSKSSRFVFCHTPSTISTSRIKRLKSTPSPTRSSSNIIFNNPPKLYWDNIKDIDMELIQTVKNQAHLFDTSNLINLKIKDCNNNKKRKATENESPSKSDIKDYWSTKNPYQLFGFDPKKSNNNIKRSVELELIKLRSAAVSIQSIEKVIPESIELSSISYEEISKLQKKATILSFAYEVALERLGNNNCTGDGDYSWHDCCEEGCKKYDRFALNTDVEKSFHYKTIASWNIEYRKTKKFSVRTMNKGPPQPHFLLENPNAGVAITSYLRSNLDSFTVGELIEFIFNNIFTPMAKFRLLVEEKLITYRNYVEMYDDDGNIRKDVEEAFTKHDIATDDIEDEIHNILQEYRLEFLCIATAYRWMEHLGFRWSHRKKSYYNDRHEDSDVVEERITFVENYVDLEKRMHRWVRVPSCEVDKLISDKVIHENIKKFGKKFTNSSGQEEFEYHVDTTEEFHRYISNENKKFGGDLSLDFPEGQKPIIIFGQDESVFDQNTYSRGSWKGPNGESTCVPKDRGVTMMVSAFVSREFGFGYSLTKEEIGIVNVYRKRNENSKYTVKSMCEALDISDTKDDLIESPFVINFEHGSHRDGYWCNDHMAKQYEDCIDCVKAIHGNKYDFWFMFDNSSGHNKMMDGALNANDLNVEYGGKKDAQSPSILLEEDIHPERADYVVGDIQSMCFDEEEKERQLKEKGIVYGPKKMLSIERTFHRDIQRDEKYEWVSPKNKLLKCITSHFNNLRSQNVQDVPENPTSQDSVAMLKGIALKWDILSSKIKKKCALKEVNVNLTIEELQHILEGDGRDTNGTLKQLQRRCIRFGIATTRMEVHGYVESWWGKPKGMAQILLERGKVEINNIYNYTKKGKKGDENTSLQKLLQECKDFQGSLTVLQHISKERGVSVMSSPRFHCELAGEGIEYAWGYIKFKYRMIPLSKKNSTKKFKECLKQVLSTRNVSNERIRRFSKRARRFICTYFVLHNINPQSTEMEQQHTDIKLKDIEKILKEFKTHRCALDFDKKFIKVEFSNEY